MIEAVCFEPAEAGVRAGRDQPRWSTRASSARSDARRRAALPDARDHPPVRGRAADASAARRRSSRRATPLRSCPWSSNGRRDGLAADRTAIPRSIRDASTTTSAPPFAWARDARTPRSALRLLAACWRYWQIRGYLTEARELAEQMLALPGRRTTPTCVRRGARGGGRDRLLAGGPGPGARLVRGGARSRPRIGATIAAIANAIYNLTFTFTLSARGPGRGRWPWPRRRWRSTGASATKRASAGRSGALANSHYFFGTWTSLARSSRRGALLFRKIDDRFMLGWTLYMTRSDQPELDPVADARRP